MINEYDIYIFDLNNCIVDIEKYHYQAWLKTLNLEFSFEYFCDKFHPKDFNSIKNFLYDQLNIYNYDEIMIDKNKNYMNILKNNISKIKLIDGIKELINFIINKNKKFIIISDTFKDNVIFFINLFPFLKKAFKYYYRYDGNKFNKDTYLNIINKYYNYKIIYFTYYISVINTLKNNIKLVYVNQHFSLNDIFSIKNYNEFFQHNLENKIINTLRLLSIDMINKANSGHPGMPLGCAPTMFVLWCKIMNYNHNNVDRDRFILSNGHGCALLYSILHLFGYYTLDDLKNFRQIHSLTPGHPEYNPNLGIEISTGPLGQGIANGVGMAIASKKLELNNKIYVMCGDGCLMEGISYESVSLAGHLELNNLILLYDSNNITIDGNTNLTFTENIKKRFESQNWNVLEVLNGDSDINDIYNKLLLTKKSDKPTIIIITTTIGYGSIKSGTSESHGTPLGEYNTKELKKYFNFDENKDFFVDNDVKLYFNDLINKNKNIIINKKIFSENNYPIMNRELNLLTNNKKNYSTRDLSNLCLNILCKYMDNIIVGSADLTESTKTLIKSDYITKNNFFGKYIHYGIREHAMIGIANGLSTFNFIPIVSTFLVFINYCLAAIRMSALSKHKVIYILTHDSIWLGEDGPSHQSCESLTILRSIPDLLVLRPSYIDEVVESYKIAINNNGPTCLILSRQTLKYIETSYIKYIDKGAYIIYQNKNWKRNYNDNIKKEIVLIATGSEVELAIDTAKELIDYNITVISMISTQLFDKQTDKYKEYILPKKAIKISIEAGSTLGWYKYANYTYGIDTFGLSGNIDDLKKYFKFTVNDLKYFIKDKITNI